MMWKDSGSIKNKRTPLLHEKDSFREVFAFGKRTMKEALHTFAHHRESCAGGYVAELAEDSTGRELRTWNLILPCEQGCWASESGGDLPIVSQSGEGQNETQSCEPPLQILSTSSCDE